MADRSFFVLILLCLFWLPYACEKTEPDENEIPILTVRDFDGNTYRTILFGDQWWMASNLQTTHYADGIEIPRVEDVSSWEALGAEDQAYCWYNNNGQAESLTFGALYTWSAMMDGARSTDNSLSIVQGVCPDGWHVPSDSEWKEMEMYLGMAVTEVDSSGPRGTSIGSQLAVSPELWGEGLLTADLAFGSSKFMALPGGGRRYNGTFGHLGESANFWSATEGDSARAWGRHIYSIYTTVHRYKNVKSDGFSVRCVKDK